MGKSILTAEEKKARKAASDKAYRERKKLGIVGRPAEADEAPVKAAKVVKVVKPKEVKVKVKESTTEKEVIASFTQTFGFPVRLFWNQRIEDENSSCAKPGTELTFEEMGKKDEDTLYRVRRGKRNFFTTAKELVEPAKESTNDSAN